MRKVEEHTTQKYLDYNKKNIKILIWLDVGIKTKFQATNTNYWRQNTKVEEHFSRIVIKTAIDMEILLLIITEIKKKCW